MQRLIVSIQLSLLLLFCFGCAAPKKFIGQIVSPNYYVCSVRSFPAKGYQKMEHFEFDYQIARVEKNQYLLSGTVKEVFGKWSGFDWQFRLTAVFVLIREHIVVDSVTIETIGVSGQIVFSKKFISDVYFDGISVAGYLGKGYG